MWNRRRFMFTLPVLVGADVVADPARAQNGPIHMGYFDKYPPFSNKDASGHMSGLLVDSVELVGKGAGLSFDHQGFPWARAQRMVEQGELDGLCTLETATRSAYAEFCATPLVTVRYGVYHRSNDTRIQSLTSIADMRALRQGSYRGSGYVQEYLEVDRILFDNDQESILRRIDMGNLDLFVEGEMVTGIKVKELGLSERIQFTPLAFLPRGDYRFALRRSYPDAHKIVERMELATQAARKSGALQALMARYRQG